MSRALQLWFSWKQFAQEALPGDLEVNGPQAQDGGHPVRCTSKEGRLFLCEPIHWLERPQQWQVETTPHCGNLRGLLFEHKLLFGAVLDKAANSSGIILKARLPSGSRSLTFPCSIGFHQGFDLGNPIPKRISAQVRKFGHVLARLC